MPKESTPIDVQPYDPEYSGAHRGDFVPVDDIAGYTPRHAEVDTPADTYEDLMKVDTNHRGHRPDGKFLSAHEMEMIASNADLIRENAPDKQRATEAEATESAEHDELSTTNNESNELSEEDIDARFKEIVASVTLAEEPAIDESGTNEVQRSRMRNFFGRRASQLRQARTQTRRFIDALRTEKIVEVAGVPLTATEYLRARLSPVQIRNNFRQNLFGAEYDVRVENPVLRDALYKQAQEGDYKAYAYLRANDPKFGEVEDSYAEHMKEVAAIFSGYAVARQLGLFAMAAHAGVKLYQAETDEDREKYDARLDEVSTRSKRRSGSVKYQMKREQYQQIANGSLTPKFHDQFSDF